MTAAQRVAPLLEEATAQLASAAQTVSWAGDEDGYNTRQTLHALLASLTALQTAVDQLAEYVDQTRD
jgi:hypothetical protein